MKTDFEQMRHLFVFCALTQTYKNKKQCMKEIFAKFNLIQIIPHEMEFQLAFVIVLTFRSFDFAQMFPSCPQMSACLTAPVAKS